MADGTDRTGSHTDRHFFKKTLYKWIGFVLKLYSISKARAE